MRCRAARAAGARALALKASGRWAAETLGDVVDQACDALLQGLIAGRYSDDAILSEETQDSPARLDRQRVWIVDPLDGTKEFRAGRPDWAIHIALTLHGRCALGVVALPARGQLLWGLIPPAHSARPGTTTDVYAGSEGMGGWAPGALASQSPLRIAVSRSHTPPWVAQLARELEAELVPAGSVGHKVGMLLRGEADLYAHKVGLKEWDTCAPETVARAMGWHVSRLDGTPQTYNQADPRNGELLVCRAQDRARVLQALQAVDA